MLPKEEELFTFANEMPAPKQPDLPAWRILIVDDEPDVHEATRFALKEQRILGRPLELCSAYSAQEAKRILADEAEFACILLDVVMETSSSGLELISYIRETLQQTSTRIVLRTGQPGYAPEVAVIEKYDVNDYKSKDELTRTRLITTLTASLRSYEQIRSILSHDESLNQFIASSRELFCEHDVDNYAAELIKQLSNILGVESSGAVCTYDRDRDQFELLAATGRYHQTSMEIGHSLPESVCQQLKAATQTQTHALDEDFILLSLQPPHSHELYIYLDFGRKTSSLDLHLIDLFCSSAPVGYDNAWLFEQMAEQAYCDPLTKLPNRAGFQKELARAVKLGNPFFLIHTDIDNFQEVNDGLGYPLGNEALVTIAHHLQEIFGEHALYGRNSSDTFCVAIFQPHQSTMSLYMRHLEASLESTFNVMGYELPLSLTSGIVRFPDHGKDADTLLQNVGIALKHAKKHQRAGYTEFGQEFEQQLQRRLQVASELRHCVERNELQLYYQPQICLKDQKVIGAEALVRWIKDGKMIPPGEFISTAETSGFIVPMGYWILEEACNEQIRWHTELGLQLKVAVNVSVRQLKDPSFIGRLDDILRRTGIDAKCLELEVTESMMMENSRDLRKILQLIRQRGLSIALDDFGTGYSSLSHLQELPINLLKIDRSFISKVTKSEEDRAITSLMIKTGELLKLRVIAEGIEEAYQHEELIKLGCHEAQGYHYSRPLSKADFMALLQEYPELESS